MSIREVESQLAAAQLEAVLSTVAEAVLLYDETTGCRWANPAAIALLGVDPRGKAQDDLARELALRRPGGVPFRPEEVPIRRAMTGERVDETPLEMDQPSTGKSVRVSLRAAPVLAPDGSSQGAVVTMTGMGAEASATAGRAAQLRDLIHDLRSPLAAIVGHAQVAERFTEKTELVRKSAQMIVSSARRMNQLLQDLSERLLPPTTGDDSPL